MKKKPDDIDFLEQSKRAMDKTKITEGYKSYTLYIKRMFETDFAQKLAKKTRGNFHIPETGFALPTEKPIGGYSVFNTPEKWVYWERKSWQKNYIFINECVEFCEEFHLNPNELVEVFENFVLFNIIEIDTDENSNGMFAIRDLAEEEKIPYRKELQEYDNIVYPIAVRINPNASKNSMANFIEKVFTSTIEPMLDKYKTTKNKIGKQRAIFKPNKERDAFIYENKDEINLADLIRKKFPNKNEDFYPSGSYITTIIKRYEKRKQNT